VALGALGILCCIYLAVAEDDKLGNKPSSSDLPDIDEGEDGYQPPGGDLGDGAALDPSAFQRNGNAEGFEYGEEETFEEGEEGEEGDEDEYDDDYEDGEEYDDDEEGEEGDGEYDDEYEEEGDEEP
jgi:hypothetical protein